MLPIRRFLPKDPYHLVLFALPWLLLALNVNWPFGNGGNWDPWFYWGHFHAFPKLHLSSPCYDGERLPMILPGYVFHHFFSPLAAQILLHIALFYVAIYSLYYILCAARDRKTALLVAVLMGCHSFFIGAMSWDYIDAFGIAYYLLALALLTRALGAPRPQPWIALAGAACGACFYINPIWLIPLAFFAFYYLVPAYKKGTGAIGSEIALFTKFSFLGLAGLTVVLGAINYLTIGTFWFYTRSLTIVSTLNTIPEWNGQSFAWLARATWIVFPTITFVGVLVYVLRATVIKAISSISPTRFHSPEAGGIFAALLLANFVYCFLALCYLTFVKKHRVLELDFYAALLIAPMFLALGSGLFTAPKAVDTRSFVKVLAFAGVICALPLWMQVRYTDILSLFPFMQPQSSLFKYYLLLPCVMGSVALLVQVLLPSRLELWRLSVLTFCAVGFGLVPNYKEYIWRSSYHGPAIYARVAHALDVIRMQSDLQRPPFFWFCANEANHYDYHAICMSLRGHGSMDLTFPSLTPTAVIPPDSLILILTENKDIPSAAEQALRQLGLHGELESQVRIADRHAAYWITFMRAKKVEPAALAARR